MRILKHAWIRQLSTRETIFIDSVFLILISPFQMNQLGWDAPDFTECAGSYVYGPHFLKYEFGDLQDDILEIVQVGIVLK